MTQATGDLLTVENLNVEFDTYGGIVQRDTRDRWRVWLR